MEADSDSITTVADLGRELRNLRISAGNPSLRELEKRAKKQGLYLPHSTAGNAQSGKILPGLNVVQAFVQACGVTSETEMLRWKSAWQRANASRDSVLGSPHSPQGVRPLPSDAGTEEPVAPFTAPLQHAAEQLKAMDRGRAAGMLAVMRPG